MPPQSQSSHSCIACARRKVKCDRLKPCSSCSRSQAACVYRAPVPSQRHRKRLSRRDLLSKIQELEAILDNHGIPFDGLGNSWIPSHWEEKLVRSRTQASPDSMSSVETASAAETQPFPSVAEDSGQEVLLELEEQDGAAWLWSELPEILKTPPISHLRQPDEDVEEKRPTSANTVPATPSIFTLDHISTPPGQLELHPDPKHVFRLWQAFADNVNPLTKIIHAPTLQEKILGAAWTAESIAKPLEATIFAVYALAVASMKPTTCLEVFGENRSVLLNRYRSGALRALSCTNLFSTRDLEVLQALTLVIMIDPQSEFSTTAVALALRTAHKMGLHRAAEDTHMPFFKQEMQVRLWWYIRGLNSRVRRGMGLLSTIDDLGDARLPMNVNDADLHPCMEKPPAVQHTAATEMVYCLMKYDLWSFVRRSSNFSGSLNPREKAAQLTASTSVESVMKKKKVLGEVGRMLEEKYLAHLDPSIPLHQLSAALAGLTIHNQQFSMLHPRNQPQRGKYMSQADQDLVFESSVRLLELNHEVRNTSFSTNLVDHMVCRTQIDALVYMVSELRRRASGHLVETAWTLLENVYSHHKMVLPWDQKFSAALTDLTLQAWETRRKGLRPEAESPTFIKTLQAGREQPKDFAEQVAGVEVLQTGLMGDWTQDEPLDWTYWNDLLQL
ncbi:Transcription factor vrtR1 [Trichoderma lentiforme]|uniref:Transcription factor vrtR1 n=1 Tax=Trichoderma lentiforme TaxID=1567552 RepID=A0A9P4XKS5_9HYPO|nr:Transcription factor vrtR1 [Trichoderma lentiforme]